MKIGSRSVGPGHPVYVIAELSANHNQSFDEAKKLIHAAKESGADAVKLQTYTADTITLRSDKEPFRIKGGTLWDGKVLHDLYREAFTPWEWQPELKALAESLGMDLFSTPFDDTAVDFLEKMDIPVFKIASFELVDLPLIRKTARTKKPLIMSTGMAQREEIAEAVTAAREAGAPAIALLKCTSAYPAPPESMNLRTIPDLATTFGVVSGLSDHTLGISVPIASVALGACIIEKHFTMSRSVQGPDSAFSLQPQEFREMVDAVRTTEKALGEVRYAPTAEERSSLAFRRSIFVVKRVKKGERFTAANVRSIRPGHGLPPKHLESVLLKSAAADIEEGTPLTWSLIADA